MAVNIVVGTSPASRGRANRGKPRKLYRGETRTIIRKALAKLQSLVNRDFRENVRSASLGYDPTFVCGPMRSADRNAVDRTMQRLRDCLDAVEGDE